MISTPSRSMRLFLLATLLLTGAAARADLKWQTTRLEFHPAVADKEVTGEFPFANAGPDPVTIDAVEPGCGCTTATLDKATYLPGEHGRVEATFHIGERTGFQDKVIRVRIRGVKDPVVLTMATYIPELVKLEPRYVFWRVGDSPEPRLIKLTVLPEARLANVHAISTNPKFKTSVQPIHQGSLYLLTVTPLDTSTDTSAVFAIEAMAAPGIPKKFSAFANIVPK